MNCQFPELLAVSGQIGFEFTGPAPSLYWSIALTIESLGDAGFYVYAPDPYVSIPSLPYHENNYPFSELLHYFTKLYEGPSQSGSGAGYLWSIWRTNLFKPENTEAAQQDYQLSIVIHCDSTGGGTKPAILVNGLSAASQYWGPQFTEGATHSGYWGDVGG